MIIKQKFLTLSSLMPFFILITTIFSLLGCEQKNEPHSFGDFVLGTWCSIDIYDGQEAGIETAFNRLQEIEEKMSRNIESSEISMLNQNAGISPILLSPDTYFVLEQALEMAKTSKGYYDPSIGPLVSLWNIGTEEAREPSSDEIMTILSLIDFDSIEMNPLDHSAFLTKKGMAVDLGGIAKGYAADEAARILKEYGVSRAIINLGGNLLTMGKKSSTQDWTIGLQDPKDSRGEFFIALPANNLSIVTSGIYERFLEVDGNFFHHILNPETGYPFDNNLISVSILCPSSIQADGLSTTVFALGLKEGLNLINSTPETEAVFVTGNNEFFLSDGLTDFQLFDSSYSAAKISN